MKALSSLVNKYFPFNVLEQNKYSYYYQVPIMINPIENREIDQKFQQKTESNY